MTFVLKIIAKSVALAGYRAYVEVKPRVKSIAMNQEF
jgi:hypothetical protein